MTKDEFIQRYLMDAGTVAAGMARITNPVATVALLNYVRERQDTLPADVVSILFPKAAVEPVADEAPAIDPSAFLLGTKSMGRLQTALDQIDEAFKAGYIIQARYKDVRANLNLAYDESRRALRNILDGRYFKDGKRIAEPSDEISAVIYTDSSLHALPTLAKRVAAVPDADYRTPMATLVKRWQPIYDKLEKLKAIIGKAPAKQKDVLPENELSRALDDALVAYKPHIQKELEAGYTRWITNFLNHWGSDLSKIDAVRKDKNAPESARKSARYARAYWQDMSPLTDAKKVDGILEYAPSASKIAPVAAEEADAICAQWKAKIMDKLTSLDECRIRKLDSTSFSIDGKVHGHAICIRQQRVTKWSSQGKMYNQFPSHIYVDGKFTPEADYKAWYAQQVAGE